MIKSNELRIGNWVSYLGAIMQLDRHDLSDLFNPSIDMYEMDLEPIELTEEILLSIEGVKQLNEYQYKFNDWFIIERYITKEKWSVRKVISEDSSILLCFLDFLHELQNITFLLTNKELEINL